MNQLALLNLPVYPDLSRGGSSLYDMGDGTARWLVVIPAYWPEAANQTGENAFWRVQAQKRKAADLLATYGRAGGPLPKFAGPVTVRMIRLWAKKCRAKDVGNLHASTKFLEDTLKKPRARERRRRLGVITDDSPRFMTPVWEQWPSRDGKSYCIVVVTGSLVEQQSTLGGAV